MTGGGRIGFSICRRITYPSPGEATNDDDTAAAQIVRKTRPSSQSVDASASQMTRKRNLASKLEQKFSTSETRSSEKGRSMNEFPGGEMNPKRQKDFGGDAAPQLQAATPTQTSNEQANAETGGDISKYNVSTTMATPGDERTQTPPPSHQHVFEYQHPKSSPSLQNAPATARALTTAQSAQELKNSGPVRQNSCCESTGKGVKVDENHQGHKEGAIVNVNTVKKLIERSSIATAESERFTRDIAPQRVRTKRARASSRVRYSSTSAGKLATPYQSDIADPRGIGGEAYSTVVWYRTIVACLVEAVDPGDRRSWSENLE